MSEAARLRLFSNNTKIMVPIKVFPPWGRSWIPIAADRLVPEPYIDLCQPAWIVLHQYTATYL